MSKGNINAAMNLLTKTMENGVLPLNAQTLFQLDPKHSDSKKAPMTFYYSSSKISTNILRDGQKSSHQDKMWPGPSGMRVWD